MVRHPVARIFVIFFAFALGIAVALYFVQNYSSQVHYQLTPTTLTVPETIEAQQVEQLDAESESQTEAQQVAEEATINSSLVFNTSPNRSSAATPPAVEEIEDELSSQESQVEETSQPTPEPETPAAQDTTEPESAEESPAEQPAVEEVIETTEPTPDPEPVVEPEETTSPPVESSASPIVISYTSTGFSPESITVTQGQSIRFFNQSATGMWVASNDHPDHTQYPGFDQGHSVSNGGIYQFTFNQLGEWGYHNHVNPDYGGTIFVTQ